MNTSNQITEKIRSAKALDFGNIFNEAIELFKKSWAKGLLFQIFNVLLAIPIIIIVFVPIMGLISTQELSGNGDTEAMENFIGSMSLLWILFVVLGSIIIGIFSMLLQVGFYRILKLLDHQQEIKTSDYFYFFKGGYFTKVFILFVIQILIGGVLFLPILPLIAYSEAFIFLIYIPVIYLMVPLSFLPIFLAFNPDMSAVEVLKTSFVLGNKKWLISFGLIFLASLLSQLGVVLCFIGLLVTLPFVYHPTYFVYKHVVGFNDSEPIDEIGMPVE